MALEGVVGWLLEAGQDSGLDDPLLPGGQRSELVLGIPRDRDAIGHGKPVECRRGTLTGRSRSCLASPSEQALNYSGPTTRETQGKSRMSRMALT